MTDDDEMLQVNSDWVIAALVAAVPPDRHRHIVIIGGLAAG
jgi:hypothetical protein